MEAELRTLWYTAVGGFAAGEGLLVAYPNVAPPDIQSSEHYLKVYTLPTTPEVFTVCGTAAHIWILQVSVYTRDGKGEIQSSAIADRLAAAFPVAYEFVGAVQTYEVQTPPSPAPRVQLDAWSSIPVSFRIQTIH